MTDPPKIMVVDDDEGIRVTLEAIFEDEGYDVVAAENGYQAIELAKKSPFVSNQQKWDTLGAERSGGGWRSGELPEGPVVASSPFGGLSLHLLPAL